MNKSTIIAVVAGLVVIAGAWFWFGKTNTPKEEIIPQPAPVTTTTTTTTTFSSTTTTPAVPAVVSEAGKHCGGNMRGAYVCATGFTCTPTPGSHLPFGDVGGTCVAN